MLGPGGNKQLKTYAQVGAVGIELALSTVLGLLGGQWLDGKLETSPFLTVFGLLIGLAAGFRSLIRTVRRASQQANKRDSESDDTPKDG